MTDRPSWKALSDRTASAVLYSLQGGLDAVPIGGMVDWCMNVVVRRGLHHQLRLVASSHNLAMADKSLTSSTKRVPDRKSGRGQDTVGLASWQARQPCPCARLCCFAHGRRGPPHGIQQGYQVEHPLPMLSLPTLTWASRSIATAGLGMTLSLANDRAPEVSLPSLHCQFKQYSEVLIQPCARLR